MFARRLSQAANLRLYSTKVVSKPVVKPTVRLVVKSANKSYSTAKKTPDSQNEAFSPSDAFPASESAPSSSASAEPAVHVTKTLKEIFPRSLNDAPGPAQDGQIDWSTTFHGLGSVPFDASVGEILNAPLEAEDVEITPDGMLYLPEIRYRRVLNRAFGPGGWGLVPRGETLVTPKSVTREYALVCHGKLVSITRGQQDYFSEAGIPMATEGCKSNALMRCCKDLSIASELWDPRFIREFKKKHCDEKFVEHVVTKRKKKLWKRKDATFEYPYKQT